MEFSILSALKMHIKIALPWYIGVVGGLFSLFLPMILQCSSYDQIGVILDRNFGFLSIIVFANTYYIEKQQKTAEIFYMQIDKNKKKEIYKRIVIRYAFTILLYLLSYHLFVLQKPYLNIGDFKSILIFKSIFAVGSSIIFFGGISYLFVNYFCNQWKGIGISIVIWCVMSSTVAKHIPNLFNLFAYGDPNKTWEYGKIFGLFIGISTFFINTRYIKISPCGFKE